MKATGALAKQAFDAASKCVKEGLFEDARFFIRDNPPSDQRIIERRIEQAMANDANRSHRET